MFFEGWIIFEFWKEVLVRGDQVWLFLGALDFTIRGVPVFTWDCVDFGFDF